MKFYESHFEEYINENNEYDIHSVCAKESKSQSQTLTKTKTKLDMIFDKMPKTITDLKNIIIYGPSGTGKYTQTLKLIKKYSPTELKYERKMSMTYNKVQYFFKVSDIHYEIDMSLLGCNSKLLWHEIYQQIIDVISAKQNKSGIIVCKYFQDIHNELLENFYSYMQSNTMSGVDIKYILVTEEISFIPDNILNCCEVVSISRPSKTSYMKCAKSKTTNKFTPENVTNIKMLHLQNEDLMLQYKIISNKIIKSIINIQELNYLKFRDILYDIFIYNLDISDCIWYIINNLYENKYIKDEHMSDILLKTYGFFQYYNNNYRPIYHVEKYFLYLAKMIHNI